MSEQSARAKILRFAQENRPSLDLPCDPETGFFVDDPDTHLSRLLDEYAHELAEQIRKQTARGNLIREEFADPWEMGLLRASDVIDPWPDGDPSAGLVRPGEEPTT